MEETRIALAPPSRQDQATVKRLLALATQSLAAMLDQQRQLFCFKLKKTERGMVQEGISQRYTAMTLMGLHRLQQAGGKPPFGTMSIVDALFSDLSWVDNVGDLGVMLWLCGVAYPERFSQVELRLDPKTALTRFKGARQGVTMELAWFLTGLSYWAQAFPGRSAELEPLAVETYKMLIQNQSAAGFFGHLSMTGSLAGMARGRTGSFADQVYPIYGLAQFAKAYENEDAAQRALQCARGLCHLQGKSGQWWWHYDAPGGRVADGYPVFSVHQHAMGPMTLFGLGEVVHEDFSSSIYKGLRWINRENELNFEMEDPANGVIWRCIYRSKRSLARYAKASLGFYSEKVEHDRAEDLKIMYECRPYELGWLLYAFATRS